LDPGQFRGGVLCHAREPTDDASRVLHETFGGDALKFVVGVLKVRKRAATAAKFGSVHEELRHTIDGAGSLRQGTLLIADLVGAGCAQGSSAPRRARPQIAKAGKAVHLAKDHSDDVVRKVLDRARMA
jgi:hypothetical protein